MKLTPAFFENLKRKPQGKYLQAGNLVMYYETYGSGRPLLLFHGGLSCIDGLRHQIPFFAKYFKVIVPERPGHGHTADIPGPYTYEALAKQAASNAARPQLPAISMLLIFKPISSAPLPQQKRVPPNRRY